VARHQWLTLVILATQQAEIRRIGSKPVQAEFRRPYLKKTQHKIGLVEWL
jgi:hypothetical protein